MRRMPSGWLAGWNSLWSRYKYALVVVLVGVLLLLLPEGKENPDDEVPPSRRRHHLYAFAAVRIVLKLTQHIYNPELK